MTKKIYLTGILVSIALLAVASLIGAAQQAAGADFPQQSAQSRTHASSTAFTLTWGTSRSILATSTRNAASATLPATAGRSGATFQALCPGQAEVWLQFNDIAAATTTGINLSATTTRSITFSDAVPNVYGAVKALASINNCTLLVTEWRTEF